MFSFSNRKIISRHTVILTIFVVTYIFGSYFFLRITALSSIKKDLTTLSHRVENDLRYEKGKWDISLYNADPNTPHPNGSSGFTTPLYIITSEGFVIERNQQINGLLDSSNFKELATYQQPQTLTTVTNESWRVLARPVMRNNRQLGMIIVAYYSPEAGSISSIDQKLADNVALIDSRIGEKNGTINTQNLDIRNIHYDVAFEVVNDYNKVLLNNGRMPTFIDRSYVAGEMNSTEKVRTVRDTVTKSSFLLLSKTITDKNNTPIGIILVGQPINSVEQLINDYLIFAILLGIGLIIPLTLSTTHKEIEVQKEKSSTGNETSTQPTLIRFDKKLSTIQIDTQTIEIPYASNQYYLCEALFTHPAKRWEQDELLERFGDMNTDEHGRKVYDAMLAVNKKLSFKLVEYKDKTYRMNPEIVGNIRK